MSCLGKVVGGGGEAELINGLSSINCNVPRLWFGQWGEAELINGLSSIICNVPRLWKYSVYVCSK